MDEIASPKNTLYILGDLFDIWVRDSINLPQYKTIINKLNTANKHGLTIYLLTGNRDFMLGNMFYKATKIKPIKNPTILNIKDKKVLLTHGDNLCIDDKNYQKMRFLLQNPISKFLLRTMPTKWLLRFTNKLQKTTNIDKANKSAIIMDVNNKAVEYLMQKYQCDILIHGHTHRPAKHLHQSGTRYVLGDWQNNCYILQYDGEFILSAYK